MTDKFAADERAAFPPDQDAPEIWEKVRALAKLVDVTIERRVPNGCTAARTETMHRVAVDLTLVSGAAALALLETIARHDPADARRRRVEAFSAFEKEGLVKRTSRPDGSADLQWLKPDDSRVIEWRAWKPTDEAGNEGIDPYEDRERAAMAFVAAFVHLRNVEENNLDGWDRAVDAREEALRDLVEANFDLIDSFETGGPDQDG